MQSRQKTGRSGDGRNGNRIARPQSAQTAGWSRSAPASGPGARAARTGGPTAGPSASHVASRRARQAGQRSG